MRRQSTKERREARARGRNEEAEEIQAVQVAQQLGQRVFRTTGLAPGGRRLAALLRAAWWGES